MLHVQNIRKELFKQVVSGIDRKYNIKEITTVEHIESSLFKSEVVTALRDVHPYTDWHIFDSGATVVVDVGEEGQGSRDLRPNECEEGQGSRDLRHNECEEGQGSRDIRHNEGEEGQGSRDLRHNEGEEGQGSRDLRHNEGEEGQGSRDLRHNEDDPKDPVISAIMKVRKDKDPGISATMTVLNTFVLSLRVNLLETGGSVALSAHYGLFCKMIIHSWIKSTDCVTASSVNMFKNKVDTYLRRAGYK